MTWRLDEREGELDSSQNSRRSRCGAPQGGFHFNPFRLSFMPEVSFFVQSRIGGDGLGC